MTDKIAGPLLCNYENGTCELRAIHAVKEENIETLFA